MQSLLMNTKNVVGLNPKYWRNRAEEARVVAESLQDEQSKQLMLGVANEYERVAEHAVQNSWRSRLVARR